MCQGAPEPFIRALWNNDIDYIQSELDKGLVFQDDITVWDSLFGGNHKLLKMLVDRGLNPDFYKYELHHQIESDIESHCHNTRWPDDDLTPPDADDIAFLIEIGALVNLIEKKQTPLDHALESRFPHPKAAKALRKVGALRYQEMSPEQRIYHSPLAYVANEAPLEQVKFWVEQKIANSDYIGQIDIYNAFQILFMRIYWGDKNNLETANYLWEALNIDHEKMHRLLDWRWIGAPEKENVLFRESVFVLIKWFSEHGFDLSYIHRSNLTALDIALKMPCPELEDALRQYGALTFEELMKQGRLEQLPSCPQDSQVRWKKIR